MKTSTHLVALLTFLLFTFSASAAVVVVKVGPNGTNSYSPQNVTIRPNDQVRWEWESGGHPTVADDGTAFAAFSLGPSNLSATRTFTMTVLTTIRYHCQPHAFQDASGAWIGMIGSIIVDPRPLATFDAKAAGVSLSVYPNPSKGLVMVSVNQKAGPDYRLRLTNILGREIRTFTLRPEAANTGMPLNLSDLPAGMYFYSLLLNDKVVSTKRFVLQN